MPFGLRNAPASFESALDIIFTGHSSQTCLVYIDAVIIFFDGAEQHLEQVDEILSILRVASVFLKFKKCLFLTNSIRNLEHIVHPATLSVDQPHVNCLEEAQPPRTQTELRSFLGFVNLYRRLTPSYMEKAQPLYELLRESSKTLPPLVTLR